MARSTRQAKIAIGKVTIIQCSGHESRRRFERGAKAPENGLPIPGLITVPALDQSDK
jgi:hypothetical protein